MRTIPKGLIPFFNDEKGQEWTPFEAQLIEAIELGKQKSTVPLHLTIDKNHRELFDKTLQSFQEKFGLQGQNPLLCRVLPSASLDRYTFYR